MFWKTSEPHGLPRNPFKSCVIPRPIGWISTISSDSVLNLAPYSFFNGISDDPPMVMFSSGGSGVDNVRMKKILLPMRRKRANLCVLWLVRILKML